MSHPIVLFLGFFLALTQITLTVLDLRELYREHGFRREQRSEVFFVAAVWLIYFLLQGLGALALPSPESFIHILETATLKTEMMNFSWRVWVALIFSFQAIAFADYVSHRWILHLPTFWILHEYHHVPKKVFNGMPGISARPYAFVATLLTAVGAAPFIWLSLDCFLLPAEAHAFLTLGIGGLFGFLGFVLVSIHSSYLRRYPWVHTVCRWLLLTSPQEHLLHHSAQRMVNYGNFSTFWDRVFRSYADPRIINLRTEELGLSYDQDFLGALCRGKWKLSRHLRTRFHLQDSVCLRD